MDEKALRDHFERIARASLPPSTVDVARARATGRRRLRIRRAGVPAASFGVALAVCALFASGVLPAGRPAATTHVHKTQAPRPAHPRGPMAPASFDPLAIYGSFGWLPPGFSVINPPSPQTTTESFAYAGRNHTGISLTVYAAGQCTFSGRFWFPRKGTFQSADGGKHKRYLHSRQYPHGLNCGEVQSVANPALPDGYLTGGRPVYLMLNYNRRPMAIAWPYARDGWAVAQWFGPKPTQLKKVAAHVRFRSNWRLRFPFRLVGIPAGWTVSEAGSQLIGGKLRGYLLSLQPGKDPQQVTILIELPNLAGPCQGIGGPTQRATFGGATGVTRTYGLEACFNNLNGMFVDVHSNRLGNAIGLLHHIQILGPDPANWTTHPLG